ncbi:uncharacterized protein LOC135212455 [Macrobrachium nipponense]|uniref:uncharacterized protein LOC135212455 n=1 Tax=Macrobrachium nipponense TaxID=159736 RepID=UPI0030C86DFC
MKFTLVFLLGVVALSTGRPDSIFDFDLDDFGHSQEIDDDHVITGSYTWTAPDGTQFFVRYIADDDGYRVLDSNAIPVSPFGLRANGQQGSFFRSSEELFDD